MLALPPSLCYYPDFISRDEETRLLCTIAAQPKPKWTVLTHRRLQTHPSTLTHQDILLAAPLPPWLATLVPRMQALDVWAGAPHAAPNHVLVNEYQPGEGIMPHKDGDAYHATVATVSLGAPIVLDIYQRGAQQPAWRILQEPRSLLVTAETLYTDHQHGIQAVDADEDINAATIANWDVLGDCAAYAEGRYGRGVRTSLTYRDVLKVSNVGGRLFGRK